MVRYRTIDPKLHQITQPEKIADFAKNRVIYQTNTHCLPNNENCSKEWIINSRQEEHMLNQFWKPVFLLYNMASKGVTQLAIFTNKYYIFIIYNTLLYW